MGKAFGKLLIFLALVPVLPLPAQSTDQPDQGFGPIDTSAPATPPAQIIQQFAAKESEFRHALDNYTYQRDVRIQTINDDGKPDGEYRQVVQITFDSNGRKSEHVTFAPQNTLEKIQMTPSDVSDIEQRLPFVLTSEEVPEYNILYVGQQQEDQLHCFVFDIAPKQIVGKKRYFQGRIWVDDHDFQIVKTYGQAVPEIKDTKKKGKEEHLYPKFTTWRQQVDNQYWFPTYTRADDTLHFNTGDIHIREVVKYEDYKRFGSNVRILYNGQEVQKADPKDQKQPPDQAPAPDQQKPNPAPNPPQK